MGECYVWVSGIARDVDKQASEEGKYFVFLGLGSSISSLGIISSKNDRLG